MTSGEGIPKYDFRRGRKLGGGAGVCQRRGEEVDELLIRFSFELSSFKRIAPQIPKYNCLLRCPCFLPVVISFT